MTATYLLDTSAWVEYLRNTGSDTHLFVRELRTARAEIATTEPVRTEVLVGAKSEREYVILDELLDEFTLLSVDNLRDYHSTALLYREARAKGTTIRKMFDCLIAAVAMRTGAVLVHNDRDFDRMAEILPQLRVQRHNRS